MMLRPLIRPLVRPLTRRVTQPGFGWSPLALFAAGEQGAWYDPSDLSSMNTKHDGSGAVPGVGDPVGYIADKSGRGNHAKQTTDTARPTLQLASGRYYLQFDGVDDALLVPGLETVLDARNAWHASIALERQADSSYPSLFGKWQSAPPRVSVDLQIRTPANQLAVERAYNGNTAIAIATPALAVGGLIVASGGYTGSSVYAQINLNSPGLVSHEYDLGSGTHIVTQSPRSGFHGKIFGQVICAFEPSSAQKAQIIRFLAAKTGVTLA